jgi:hypothetical protein
MSPGLCSVMYDVTGTAEEVEGKGPDVEAEVSHVHAPVRIFVA